MNAVRGLGADGHGAAHLVGATSRAGGPAVQAPSCAAAPSKRKRRPAGTPDPDAEVVALSPKTLMESDKYVCEICNQGFQRDQNLQMHRRRHKVPWKLLKRPNSKTTKRVYICPEKSCLHHDPGHALGDLVGIKKHYRRKHCTEKQWRCDKCSKGYAVQSDYKAHMKTCGTRGHCCDCGRVFSRVESFIEHQDTCSSVKRRATQSESGGKRIPAHDGTVDTRNSTQSPSQSSDTTQAMSITQSGMSDTTAKSGDYMNSASNILEEHARRIQENHPALPVMSPPAAMPAWLMDHIQRNKVVPLQRVPTDHTQSRQEVITWPARADQATHGSTTSQATHCSSNPAPQPCEVISCPEMRRSVHEPSLQLSIGPAIASSSVSPYPDTKPTFRNSVAMDTEAAWKDYPPRQFGFTVLSARAEKSSDPGTVVEFDATKGQSGVIRKMGGAGPRDYNAVRSTGTCFLAALSPVESSAGFIVHQSRKKDDGKVNCSTEMVSRYNAACARSTPSHHETRLGIHMQESVNPAPGPRATRRGSLPNAQLQPALSPVVTQKKAPHLGIAESDHLFDTKLAGPNEVDMKSQNRIAAATTGQASCDQTPGKVNAAWSDFFTSARQTTDEARQECVETQREVARAESLKREAREQLHCAAAQKTYADRAREIAKRHVEFSEAELVKAKRLRLRAQAELLQASSQANFSPSFCLSCKPTIQDLTVPSRKSTSTSPTSRSMLAPSPTALEQSKIGSRRSTQMVMNPGNDVSLELEIGAKHADHQVATGSHGFYDSANMMSWSAGALWPNSHGYSRTSTSMTIGEPAPSAGVNRPGLVAVQVPAQAHRRDPFASKSLDLT